MAGGGPGSFRYTVWDPFMIVAQMATLQSLYYVSLGLWIFVFDIIQGSPRSLDQIFMYQVSFISCNLGNIYVALYIFVLIHNTIKNIILVHLFLESSRYTNARKIPHSILPF